ncbi:hypothetical protein L873DRAFT_1170537 [Choiromyces venosus 120613-1]|uniref:Uncharacterized protein n=1 Tax=Choiromyces venosus 120613-1 TaxID=1336337 RepID=A0A3N4KFX1_9PEZI|nr:hypothetical protein L873DRAFT_1170537 [Choiromyces venosus 120613-1]
MKYHSGMGLMFGGVCFLVFCYVGLHIVLWYGIVVSNPGEGKFSRYVKQKNPGVLHTMTLKLFKPHRSIYADTQCCAIPFQSNPVQVQFPYPIQSTPPQLPTPTKSTDRSTEQTKLKRTKKVLCETHIPPAPSIPPSLPKK